MSALASTEAAAIRAAAAADQSSVVDLLQRLVRIPSRGGLDPYEPVLEVLDGWLSERGLVPRRLYDGAGSPVALVCEVEGAHPGPLYVLDACIDTAPFGNERAWTYPPTSGVVVNGWLHGRGSADCKAAAAIFCHLAVRLQEQRDRLQGTVALLFDADEHTGRFTGAKRYFGQEVTPEQVAGVMIGYPGANSVVVGSRGFLRASLTVHGVAGHSGSSRAGSSVNAVEKAALLVSELTRQPLPEPAEESFPLGPKLTTTAIHGGEPTGGFTIVPDRCTVQVDIRLTPAFDARAAAKLLENAAASLDARWPSGRPTGIQFEESWPAYRLPPASRLGRALVESASWATGRPVRAKVVGPSNIGNYLAALGIEATAGFGVVYEGLHGIDERIQISSIPAAQAAYHRAVLGLLNGCQDS